MWLWVWVLGCGEKSPTVEAGAVVVSGLRSEECDTDAACEPDFEATAGAGTARVVDGGQGRDCCKEFDVRAMVSEAPFVDVTYVLSGDEECDCYCEHVLTYDLVLDPGTWTIRTAGASAEVTIE